MKINSRPFLWSVGFVVILLVSVVVQEVNYPAGIAIGVIGAVWGFGGLWYFFVRHRR